jgi:molybdenum cofactor cytidylyltransferase
MRKIGAIILAAGESSRFGQSKQLILFRGKSLVRRMIDAAGKAGCSPVMVVTGSDGEKVARESTQTRAIRLQNKNWQQGIGSSIRVGVQRLIDDHPDVEAVVLLVCDQPFVDANTIRSLITLRETTKKSIIASTYADTLGVPALFDHSLFQELLSLGEGAGAKSIILQNRGRAAQLPFPEGHIDIDSWDDYQRLMNRIRHRAGDNSSPTKSRWNERKKRPGIPQGFRAAGQQAHQWRML